MPVLIWHLMFVRVETGILDYLSARYPEMDAPMTLLVMVPIVTSIMLTVAATYRCTCTVLMILLNFILHLIIPKNLFRATPRAGVIHPIEKFGESYKDVCPRMKFPRNRMRSAPRKSHTKICCLW